MKKNKVVILFVVAILIIVGIDVGLFFRANQINHNKEENPEDGIIELDKRVECHKEGNLDSEIGIKYRMEEDYNFYVAKNQELVPDNYISKLTFNNLEDLKTYYNYLVDVVKIPVLANFMLEQDEENLTISYSRGIIQGGYESFSEEYLEDLKNHEYTCKVIELSFNLTENE